MSISGVSSFTPFPTNDPRAEFQRLREAHAKNGPSGYEDREKEATGPNPSVAAAALADASAIDPTRSAALRKVDISV